MNAPARIAELERELYWAQLEIQVLRENLRQAHIKHLGPRSEALGDLQLKLLAEEEPSATRAEVEAEARREPLMSTPPREHKPHPGRKPLPEKRPRVCWLPPIYKPMKLRCRCSCTISAAKIIRPICGNTESRAARQCLISAWGANAPGLDARTGCM